VHVVFVDGRAERRAPGALPLAAAVKDQFTDGFDVAGRELEFAGELMLRRAVSAMTGTA
jgi:hypothetical protein